MEVTDEVLRVLIYATLAGTGTAPSVADLAETADEARADVRARLHRLAQARHLVLDDADEIVMAHPFSAIPLGFAVMGRQTLWWGGCAWDSFALPHLLTDESEVLVATRCPGCGKALAWNVGRDGPPAGDHVAHFLVPVAHMWDDVVHTCSNQRLFCGEACVDSWLARTGNAKGYVMDLPTLWRLARGWYAGRLDHGYTRRDPPSAAQYFRDAGLHGPFWGR